MDKEDSDFLHILFRENNDLRLKFNAAQRELYNKTVQNEAAEDEIRQLKLKLDVAGGVPLAPTTPDRASTAASGLSGSAGASRPTTNTSSKRPARGTPDATLPPPPPAPAVHHVSSKELQEALFSLERKTAELKLLNEDYAALKGALDDQMIMAGTYRKEIADLKLEVNELKNFKTNAIKESELLHAKLEERSPVDASDLKIEIEIKDGIITNMKKQAIEMATDADRKNNELQNQLQGVEALIDGIRKEYEEFIQITKLETESFRANQLNEYNELKSSFESLKLTQFEEKKRIATEYAGLLHSMQSQFEEYRTATEYMFNSEISKLEEELSHQSIKFEHEVMYVIQAKDKFYADMMVSKDAKIMNLIEGSDLQTLMQKHELDMENLRKDHAREIEMVKSDQESEQKNLISLLQRHNVSLESKCEKLQAHLKTLEMRIRELMGTIEAKMKIINDREEQKIRLEAEYESKLAECHAQITALGHEKEHLRHKVIRLNLNAKGEGGNSIENMIKRISRETTDLHVEFEQLSIRYDSLIGENQVLVKRLKEREKFAEFMEKEVARRTEEYLAMTNTFEEFLMSRARQSRKERIKKLPKIQDRIGSADKSKKAETTSALLAKSLYKPSILKSVIPDRDDKSAVITEEAGDRKLELERGNLYLRKFKTLSRAFATGDFRILPNGQYNAHNAPDVDTVPGPWQKSNLYRRMDDASLALARLYKEPTKTQWDPSSKPTIYNSASQIAVAPPNQTKIYTDNTANELKLLRATQGKIAAEEKEAEEALEEKPDIKAQILVGKSIRKKGINA
ncbi:UNVERIFIED_CONTAM: hypothetical protein HDU68_001638 [Siphonaria sp. JEL0065]|nr:hypothetical protein HDU68_001638 [Siphonaria sp. JEL0065]